jgi:protease-4
MKFSFLFPLLVLGVLSAQAWSPLIDNQPATEHSGGLFGNPALLGPVEGIGWLASFAPATHGTQNLRMGAHTEYFAGSFSWSDNPDSGINDRKWNLGSTLSSPGDAVSLGLRASLWRSSRFKGNAWSTTPGLVIRPLRQLSFGFTSLDLFANKESHAAHQLGIAFRPIDPITVSLSATNSQAELSVGKHLQLAAQADLHWGAYEVGFSSPLRPSDTIPWGISLSIPVGAHQSLAVLGNSHRLQSFGINGHLNRRPTNQVSSRWVRLGLNGKLVETRQAFFLFSDNAVSLPDLQRQFRIIEGDPSIAGVMIDLDGFEGSLAIAAEIRRGIQDLRKHGKGTIAYLTELRPGLYYAASAAERVVLQPSSRVHLRGLSSNVLHFKGFLDFIGVKAELLRHGRYKSAVEPFVQDTMSTEAKEDLKKLLDGLWNTLRDSVATSRKISPDSLDAIARISPLTANQAKALGLVDTTLYFDEIKGYAKVDHFEPWSFSEQEIYRDDWNPRPKILVVNLEGDIVDGPSSMGLSGNRNVGARTFGDLTESIRQSPDFSAVVLRINSPGGSAQASDILWHRLQTLSKDLDVPMVASIGGMAASGGYYLACAAQKIVAEPTSLVGSIGVFGGKVDASQLFTKIRINPVTVKTHPSADAESFTRGLSPEEQEILQASMDDTYERFVGVVANARGKTPAQIDSLGEGRVFTAVEGVRNGLVDTLGGLNVAIRTAANLAGIPASLELSTVYISYGTNWDLEFGRSAEKSLFPWLSWLETLEDPQVWALWNPGLSSFGE